jgi:kynureninase
MTLTSGPGTTSTTDDVLRRLPADLVAEAAELDRADPIAAYTRRFADHPDVVAYLDGNSLGRPLASTASRLSEFVDQEWGGRLIRAWDEGWFERPLELGDALGEAVLGAAPGQTVIGDSTTVLLYKLVHAAVTARPGRREIVIDTENFPTDRYVVESIARERDLVVRWIEPDPARGVELDEVVAVVGEQTALVVLSHVAYKSAQLADLPAITAAAHRVGALVLWDLCHSAGVVEIDLDATDVDLAVGCSYKYLNGGPGAPGFAYVARRLHDDLHQPIPGWMGHADPFRMGPDYEPARGIRRMISGTPPIVGMLPLQGMVELIAEAGLARVRTKSVDLTEFALRLSDRALAEHGVVVASPRDAAERGGHVTIEHPRAREVVAELWKRGVIPDFRPPHGVRVGLSPLSTRFGEVALAFAHLADVLADVPADGSH